MTSRLGMQLTETLSMLRKLDVPAALIGGLALSAYKVVRATQDVDLLIDQAHSDRVHQAMIALGYQPLHRTADVANYQRNDERVDYLYASRPIAKQLLDNATEVETSLGVLRVIRIEGLIGFKLQGFVNNPKRAQDMEDIKALLHANRDSLNINEVREYFILFERESLLDELLR
jgi:hypothetical protein